MDIKSFVQTIAEKSLATFDDKSPEAFDKLMNLALVALPPKENLDVLSLGARNSAEEAIKLLQRKKEDLLGLGRFGLVAVLSYLAVGKTEEAVDLYLKKQNKLSRVLSDSLAADEAAIKNKREWEAHKKKALEILREIGGLTARYALPALLGAI